MVESHNFLPFQRCMWPSEFSVLNCPFLKSWLCVANPTDHTATPETVSCLLLQDVVHKLGRNVHQHRTYSMLPGVQQTPEGSPGRGRQQARSKHLALNTFLVMKGKPTPGLQ